MKLRALIFGHDMQCNQQEVARRAYNYVFADAGLNWHWSAEQFASVMAESSGLDIVRTYIRNSHPNWRWTDDLALMVRSIERRHATICGDLLENGACRDFAVAAVIAEAQRADIAVAALSRSPVAARDWMSAGIVIARDLVTAITNLAVRPEEALAITRHAADLTEAQRLNVIAIDLANCDAATAPAEAMRQLERHYELHSQRLRRARVVAHTSEKEDKRCSLPTF